MYSDVLIENVHVQDSMQRSQIILAGSPPLASAEPRFITPENSFPLLHSAMTGSFTSLLLTFGIAHGDLRLVCSWSAMETHFMTLQTNSYCADVTSRSRLELGSECCN